MPDRKVEINIVVKTEGGKLVAELGDTMGTVGDQFEAVEKRGSKFGSAMQQIVDGVWLRMGQRATDLVLQLPQMAAELFQTGVQSEATSRRFEAFAGGVDEAEGYLRAFSEATDGTVSRMAAMGGASKLLQMGLVETEEDMGLVASIATKLGDQTASASDRISDFALLLANQSIPRLDNFGISSGKVRKRIEELQSQIAGLSREEAFKIAVMEEGRKALEILGDVSDTTSVKMAKLTAAVDDAKEGLGLLILKAIEGGYEIDNLAERIRNIPTWLEQGIIFNRAMNDAIDAVKHFRDPAEAFRNTMVRLAAANTDWAHTSEISRYQQYQVIEAVKEETYWEDELIAKVNILHGEIQDGVTWHDQYEMAVEQSYEAMDRAAISALEYRQRQEELSAALQKHAEAAFALAGEWHKFEAGRTETAEDFATKREKIEADYLARLEELQGQAVATTGKNVDEMIAEAERQRDESIAALEEQAAEQERIQRESFARMLINTLTAYAEMKGVAPAEVLKMQTAISEQYGLIDEQTASSARNWITALDMWAEGADIDLAAYANRLYETGDVLETETADWEDRLSEFSDHASLTMGEASGAFGLAADGAHDLLEAINAIPMTKTIEIRVKEIKETVSQYSPGATIPELTMQGGFEGIVGPGFGGPIRALIGEGSRPEYVRVQPVTNNYNMSVYTRATSPTVQSDFRILEALGARQ